MTRLGEHTRRYEVSRNLLEEGDEQNVVVIDAAAILADGVVVGVCRAGDFLWVAQNTRVFAHNLQHDLASKRNSDSKASAYQFLDARRHFCGEGFVD